jgi:CRISPR-associated protein Cas5d
MTSLCLEVRGDYACFTRPELKVERVSYDVMTPSAARAVFEAVLWKPAIRWEVDKIEVLRPIQWSSIRRNEVASRVPTGSVEIAMRGGDRLRPFYADDDRQRQQRASLLLRDVAYRIWAQPFLTERAGSSDGLTKYVEMFRRRAEHGQCVNQPYLGCREFACRFELVEDAATRSTAIDESRDLGVMLYDLDFADSQTPQPLFFRANLKQGVLQVPKRDSAEVLS